MTNSTRAPLVIGAAAIAALGFVSAIDIAPRLMWNASASAPIGLYRIDRRAPAIGDYVLVDPSPALKELIAARGYLPPEIPLLKRVAALSGADICRAGTKIFIDDRRAADALPFDSFGRDLPLWNGCFSLGDDEIFLLNLPAKSLDGRYFGATKLNAVIGVATPLFIAKSSVESAEHVRGSPRCDRASSQPKLS